MQTTFDGTWCYRSLLNDSDPTTPFEKLRFGAGLLYLETQQDFQLRGRLEFGDDLLHDRRDIGRIRRATGIADRATADWLIGEAMIRQHALQLAAESAQVCPLFIGQRLTSVSHLEASQTDRSSEAFRELGRVDHRVE